MTLGVFSNSLTVADMDASRTFYQNLGFEVTGGDGESWVILVNGTAVIGLFHGMFDQNIMTFNPGWDGPGEAATNFADVRELRKKIAAHGIEVTDDSTGDSESGPASFMVVDPDGNQILIDQHV